MHLSIGAFWVMGPKQNGAFVGDGVASSRSIGASGDFLDSSGVGGNADAMTSSFDENAPWERYTESDLHGKQKYFRVINRMKEKEETLHTQSPEGRHS